MHSSFWFSGRARRLQSDTPRAARCQLEPVQAQQLDVTLQVVGPVAGNPAPALGA